MDKIWKYFLLGIVVAIVGLFVTNFIARFLDMEYGSACVLSICMYLSVVVVTCTGIIIEEIHDKQSD